MLEKICARLFHFFNFSILIFISFHDLLIFFRDFCFSCDSWKYFVRGSFKHFTPRKDLEGGEPYSRGHFVKEGSLIKLI